MIYLYSRSLSLKHMWAGKRESTASLKIWHSSEYTITLPLKIYILHRMTREKPISEVTFNLTYIPSSLSKRSACWPSHMKIAVTTFFFFLDKRKKMHTFAKISQTKGVNQCFFTPTSATTPTKTSATTIRETPMIIILPILSYRSAFSSSPNAIGKYRRN